MEPDMAEDQSAPGAADRLATEWDELADRLDAPPFLRPGWVRSWWRSFRPGVARLRIVSVRDEGALRAVLPMVSHRGALRSPTNWHTPVFGPLAVDDVALLEVLRRALAERPRMLELSFAERTGGLDEAWRAATTEAGYRTLERPLLRSPLLPIEVSWDDHLATVSQGVRKELARRRRRLVEQGRVWFDGQDGVGELGPRLEEGFRVEGSGWKGRDGTAILSRLETRRFYTDVATWAASRGMLRLLFLRLEGRPIAFHLCLEHAGVRHLLKSGYDPELERFGPGKLLMEDDLADAFAAGLRAYHFGGEDSPMKREWTSHGVERWKLQAFAPTAAGRAAHLAYARGRPAAKWVLERRGRPLRGRRRPRAGTR
jgi:CelD/BcsL family acetyltransferase involved in cellulose biosynthesis